MSDICYAISILSIINFDPTCIPSNAFPQKEVFSLIVIMIEEERNRQELRSFDFYLFLWVIHG